MGAKNLNPPLKITLQVLRAYIDIVLQIINVSSFIKNSQVIIINFKHRLLTAYKCFINFPITKNNYFSL